MIIYIQCYNECIHKTNLHPLPCQEKLVILRLSYSTSFLLLQETEKTTKKEKEKEKKDGRG